MLMKYALFLETRTVRVDSSLCAPSVYLRREECSVDVWRGEILQEQKGVRGEDSGCFEAECGCVEGLGSFGSREG